MMFPYPSAYTYLMDMFRPKQRTPWDEMSPVGGGTFGQRPWDTGAGASGGMGDMGAGAGTATGDGGRRRAIGAGLLSLGTSLLEAAPRGDWSGSLARGVAGFSESMVADRERSRREMMEAREEQRRQAQETRAVEQEADRNRADDLRYEQGTAELEAWREQQERGKQARLKTGKSADQMVAEIEALAAANPGDQKLGVMAKRAAGYALGEDSDLNKLADLHEQMTQQAFRQQDVDWETQAGIGKSRAEIEAGVRPDPKAAERRANEELAISRGHLGIARERAAQEKEGLTDVQAYDRLERKIKEKFDKKVEMHMQTVSREPTPFELKQWREEAQREAMTEMQQNYNRVLRFTESGDFIDD